MTDPNAATESSQVARDDWAAFLSTFSTENRGRTVSVEVVGESVGDQPLFTDVPLLAIDFDPEGKGDDIVISAGENLEDAHNVVAPTELWTARNDNGVILALEIIDATDVRTILRLVE